MQVIKEILKNNLFIKTEYKKNKTIKWQIEIYQKI